MSNWIGKEGERRAFKVIVLRNFAFPSKFTDKNCYVYIMHDEFGNEITLNSSQILEVGVTYLLRATIKAHVEREGIKQTQIVNYAFLNLLL